MHAMRSDAYLCFNMHSLKTVIPLLMHCWKLDVSGMFYELCPIMMMSQLIDSVLRLIDTVNKRLSVN